MCVLANHDQANALHGLCDECYCFHYSPQLTCVEEFLDDVFGFIRRENVEGGIAGVGVDQQGVELSPTLKVSAVETQDLRTEQEKQRMLKFLIKFHLIIVPLCLGAFYNLSPFCLFCLVVICLKFSHFFTSFFFPVCLFLHF